MHLCYPQLSSRVVLLVVVLVSLVLNISDMAENQRFVGVQLL